MDADADILLRVRAASAKRRLYLPHALRQMMRPDRMIASNEVQLVIDSGRVIEDYPKDSRGHSCLMLGFGEKGRPVHVVCSPKNDYLAIITAYVPDASEWTDGFEKRKKR